LPLSEKQGIGSWILPLATHVPLVIPESKIRNNGLSRAQQDIYFPETEDVNSEIAKKLSSIFVSRYASNIKTPKIFSRNKNTFVSLLEYTEFLIKYVEAKFTSKAIIHKMRGFLKHYLGKK
jgi:hypothetical protein